MIKALYDRIKDQLNSDLDARWIIEERTGCTWSDIVLQPDLVLNAEQIRHIEKDVESRLSGKPLSRIYGMAEFWGMPFHLNAQTLDPRPETELIIELALQRFAKDTPLRILDLGTGTGCVLISLLSEFKNAIGFATDFSYAALKQAQKNAALNQVDSRIHFVCCSWFEGIDSHFDLIVSNPPYIESAVIPTLSKEVRDYDPILALDGGDEGLNPYQIIFPHLKTVLSPYGKAFFEIGYNQADKMMRLAEECGFALRRVHHDIAENPRVVEISCGDK